MEAEYKQFSFVNLPADARKESLSARIALQRIQRTSVCFVCGGKERGGFPWLREAALLGVCSLCRQGQFVECWRPTCQFTECRGMRPNFLEVRKDLSLQPSDRDTPSGSSHPSRRSDRNTAVPSPSLKAVYHAISENFFASSEDSAGDLTACSHNTRPEAVPMRCMCHDGRSA